MPRKLWLEPGVMNPAWRPDTRTRTGHSGPSGRSGTKVSKWSRGEFVAWDSEGADIGGAHKMIVLANSYDVPLADSRGIGSAEALEYIAAGLARYHRAIHVAFVFSYDVNMILRDLHPKFITELWNTGSTTWRHYRIQYIPRKSFGLWSYVNGQKFGGVIWDVFGFCQSSFVEALKKYKVGTAEQVGRIEAMKKQRATFRPEDLCEITRYCVDECRLLSDGLAPAIRNSFDAAGIQLTRFDGAGAAAAALLKRERVEQHFKPLPDPVEQAARHAYFGGRIECLKYGNAPATEIWGYDINSAYPAAALDMPSLASGKWLNYHKFRPGFGIWRIKWSFDIAALLPLPWRAKTGSIYFPMEGEGWYWEPEAKAAIEYAKQTGGYIEVIDGWLFKPSSNAKPFAFLQREYDKRREYKRAGNAGEKALKLAINSVYGKLAQQVGYKPRWHNLAYAGWITSTTRARLWQASRLSPGAVLMLATDAIYSTVPLNLPEGEALGQWESSHYIGACIVQSGVYWLGDNELPKGRRGFDLLSLSKSGIIKAWSVGAREYPARHTAFVGMGEASNRNAWDDWCSWRERPRMLALTPEGTKRQPASNKTRAAARELLVTLPVTPLTGSQMSAPIVRPWDDGEPIRTEYETERREILENESWAE